MFSKVGVARITVVAVGLGLLGHAAPSAAAGRGTPGAQKPVTPAQPPAIGTPQRPEPGAVVRGDQLTREQFEALPDTATIEVKGQRATKAQIRAKAAKGQEAQAKAEAASREGKAKFEARRAQFLQQQQAKLEADNGKVSAQLAGLRRPSVRPQTGRQREALQGEAADLINRSKTASPAERAQIEKRAVELLRQLQSGR